MAQTLSRYLYSGPFSGVTLAGAGKTDRPREVLLFPGKPALLPADHPYTQALLAQGRLRPLAESAPAEPAAAQPMAAQRPSARKAPGAAPAQTQAGAPEPEETK